MRRFLAMILLAVAQLSSSACGDVARTELELAFTSEDLRASTQQLLFVLRAPTGAGDQCAGLWGAAPAGPINEKAWLVDYPNPVDVSVMRLDVGSYVTLAYALPARLDALCSENGEADCQASSVGKACKSVAGGQRACLPPSGELSPLAGGCLATLITADEVKTQVLQLAPR